MAIPTVTGTPTSGKGGGNLTITLDAGLSIVAICTQAENLPTASSAQINHASSGWTCIVGTKGGAGYSDAGVSGIYLYVFHKVTTAGETITTGDSGVFQVYQALTVTGYNTTTPIEAVAYKVKSISPLGVYLIGSVDSGGFPISTTGPDRLVVAFGAPNKDTNTAFAGTWSSDDLSDETTITAQQTALGSGGGLVGFYGGYASDSDGGDWNSGATATDATYGLTNTLQATLAVVPPPTYNDSGTGTVSLSGSKTESLSHTGTSSGTVALAGSGTDALAFADSRSGSLAITGSGTDSLAFADARTGAVPVTGSGTESHSTGASTRRRLFATDPFMGGAPLRSSIDFTE